MPHPVIEHVQAMSLTADLVALCHRELPESGNAYLTDVMRRQILSSSLSVAGGAAIGSVAGRNATAAQELETIPPGAASRPITARCMALSLSLLLAPVQVAANVDSGTECDGPEAALVLALTEWIGRNTRYDISTALNDPPRVHCTRHGDLISYEGRRMIVEPSMRALYDSNRRRILLVEPWSTETPYDASTLLHELVHDVQSTSRYWECHGASEWEAYKLQEAWLAERGLEVEFDLPRIFMLSLCPDDVHP